MIDQLRQLYSRMFGSAAPAELAQRELDHAHRELLKHASAAEYHRHMVAYYNEVVRRLTKVKV